MTSLIHPSHLFRPLPDVVHPSNPQHLVHRLNLLVNALVALHLPDDDFQSGLCLIIQISQILIQLTGQEQRLYSPDLCPLR